MPSCPPTEAEWRATWIKNAIRPGPVIVNCTNITAALRPHAGVDEYGRTIYHGADAHTYTADDAEYVNGTYYFMGHEVDVTEFVNESGHKATKILLPAYCEHELPPF